jgi:chitin disaccharide deacetylase
MDPPRLLITADDFGYSRRVNDGILVAARAGAIDAVSAMVGRDDCEPGPLLSSGVRIGLHLEPPGEDEAPEGAVERQVELFERLFGGPPGHLDGHHHCHASAPLAEAVELLATGLAVPVRAISAEHRRRLRERGIDCPDRIVGRMKEEDPVQPAALTALLSGGGLPPGLTEWVVHPGFADPGLGSAYDAGREEDLTVLLALASTPALLAARGLG